MTTIKAIARDIAEDAICNGSLFDYARDTDFDVREFVLTAEDVEYAREVREDIDVIELQREVREVLARRFQEDEDRRIDAEYDAQKVYYCADRMCGATDCGVCYP